MGNKRYSIVRVNNCCPDVFEKINSRFVCEINGDFKPACKNCRYGDTKEQLIRKIVQVLRQPNSLIVGKDKQHSHSAEYLAEEIVEFLGVEE